jgi:SPP1 gp7 family putative phage head morphogenesis protein
MATQATQSKKRPYQQIVTEIIIKPPQRKTSDVGIWRTALKSADMGRMKLIYDLYEDLLIDGVLSDAVDKRIEAVTNSPITFQDANGQEVPEIVEMIDSTDFEELLTTIMQKLFWGRAGGEFNFTNGWMEFTPIPPKHINLNNHNILINEYDDTGYDYENDDFIMILGKPRDFGLFLKTAPFAIWKRGGFGDYAQWLELFGMPQRVGKYSSYDSQSRQLLEQAMEKAGSAPWIVIPKETDVETTNNTGTGSSSNAHNEFRKACNEELLITILGQTMTTLDGSSRSQSETHKAVEESKHRRDLRYVRRVLNWIILPTLEKRGFPVRGGKFIFPDATEPLTVENIISLSKIISIPTTYIRNKYSIPEPQEDEETAGSQTSQNKTQIQPNQDDEPVYDDEPVKNADHRKWFLRLYDFFAAAPGSGALNGNRHTINLIDGDINDRLINRVADGLRTFDPDLFNWISTDLLTALDNPARIQMADLGFQYNFQNDAFRTAQELNIFHFSAAKSLAEIQRLNELYRQSKSFEEFYKAASDELDVFNKTWQKTEWQTAGLIAAGTQNYNRLVAKTNLFPYWEYRTVGDDKVRPEHAKLHGIILPANDPRWKKIWPPNGWKCRCYIIALMAHEVKDIDIEAMRARVDAFFETKEWKAARAQGFGINRALSPELFKANQMYIKKFPNQAARLLKNVNYNTYGLKSYKTMRKTTTANLPLFEGTADEYVNTTRKEAGKSLFTDYWGRSIVFDKDVFLQAYMAPETKYLKAAADTLQTPDEIWINNTGSESKTMDRYVFLKYYKDMTFAVTGSIKNNAYQVTTFFPVIEKSKYKYRWGLLIKKPV